SVFTLPADGCRDDARRFVERYDGLLWDAAANEGGSCSKHVLHGGPTPHQSLKHLVPWMAGRAGERFVVAGGTDVLGRELARVARSTLARIGIKPVGVATDVDGAVRLAAQADVVLSTRSGAAAVELMRAHRAAGIKAIIASPTLGEIEVAAAGRDAIGHVAAQPYFASWISPANWRFLDRMRRRHGARVTPSASAEAIWTQIALFGTALSHLSDTDVHPLNIREAVKGVRVEAPQGLVELEAESLHARLWPKIAVVEPSGRLGIVARARQAVRPLPYWAHANRACTDDGAVTARNNVLARDSE
ncbi:MAG TPA: transporter substrate-binding protein, partial [Candidatus Omnitrophota bacterium]|nr:transporter substrate-binding protein [Candidatus Omnitrophota bacterium]